MCVAGVGESRQKGSAGKKKIKIRQLFIRCWSRIGCKPFSSAERSIVSLSCLHSSHRTHVYTTIIIIMLYVCLAILMGSRGCQRPKKGVFISHVGRCDAKDPSQTLLITVAGAWMRCNMRVLRKYHFSGEEKAKKRERKTRTKQEEKAKAKNKHKRTKISCCC